MFFFVNYPVLRSDMNFNDFQDWTGLEMAKDLCTMHTVYAWLLGRGEQLFVSRCFLNWLGTLA